MQPIEFPEVNVVLAKDQPEYTPMPVYRSEDGQVISCWKLTLCERIKLLFTGRMWFVVLTFGGRLQPQCPMVNRPFVKADGDKQER